MTVRIPKIGFQRKAHWVKAGMKFLYHQSFKGKSPVVLFHQITSPYRYFEEIFIFAPILQEEQHDQGKLN